MKRNKRKWLSETNKKIQDKHLRERYPMIHLKLKAI